MKGEVTKVGPVSPWREGVLGPQSRAWPSSPPFPPVQARSRPGLVCTTGRGRGLRFPLLSFPRPCCLFRGWSLPWGGSVSEAMFGWVSGGSEGCRPGLAARSGWGQGPRSLGCSGPRPSQLLVAAATPRRHLCPAPQPGFSVLWPLALLGFLAIATPVTLYRGGPWKVPFGWALGIGPAHWLIGRGLPFQSFSGWERVAETGRGWGPLGLWGTRISPES